MPSELVALAWSVVLGFVYLFAQAASATRQRGQAWNLGTREGNPPPLTGVAFRLDQALKNFLETYPLFVAALLGVVTAGKLCSLASTGAWIYVAARLAYLPVYGLGINYLRSALWMVSVVGIVCVLTAFLQ